MIQPNCFRPQKITNKLYYLEKCQIHIHFLFSKAHSYILLISINIKYQYPEIPGALYPSYIRGNYNRAVHFS